MPVPRYAISYTPPPDSPLARFGAGVLGYDCYHATEVPFREIEGIEPAILRLITVEPRRHGFHAVFVAPFQLADGDEDELRDEIGRFARTRGVIPSGPLEIVTVDRFVALRPIETVSLPEEFAAACEEAFEPFGAAPTTERRAFRFELVLAGPLPNGETKPVAKAFDAAFAPMAADRLEIDAISLMRQDDSSKRFHVVERWRLTGR